MTDQTKKTSPLPRFQPEGEFSKALKDRVNQYFKENNLSKNANGEMIFKTIFYLVALVSTYLIILFGSFTGWSL